MQQMACFRQALFTELERLSCKPGLSNIHVGTKNRARRRRSSAQAGLNIAHAVVVQQDAELIIKRLLAGQALFGSAQNIFPVIRMDPAHKELMSWWNVLR